MLKMKTNKAKTAIPSLAHTNPPPWSVTVAMGEPKRLGTQVPRGVMIMRNRGPSGVIVRIGYDERDEMLAAGDTKIIAVRGQISLAAVDLYPSTIDFTYMR